MRSGQIRTRLSLPEVENYDDIYLLYEYFPDFLQYCELIDFILMNAQTEFETPVEIESESEFEIYTGETESWFPYFKGKKIIMDGR